MCPHLKGERTQARELHHSDPHSKMVVGSAQLVFHSRWSASPFLLLSPADLFAGCPSQFRPQTINFFCWFPFSLGAHSHFPFNWSYLVFTPGQFCIPLAAKFNSLFLILRKSPPLTLTKDDTITEEVSHVYLRFFGGPFLPLLLSFQPQDSAPPS